MEGGLTGLESLDCPVRSGHMSTQSAPVGRSLGRRLSMHTGQVGGLEDSAVN